VRILPVTKDSSMMSKVMDLVPDVVSKFQKHGSENP
jgi:uncharacterized spore protein YtfJ